MTLFGIFLLFEVGKYSYEISAFAASINFASSAFSLGRAVPSVYTAVPHSLFMGQSFMQILQHFAAISSPSLVRAALSIYEAVLHYLLTFSGWDIPMCGYHSTLLAPDLLHIREPHVHAQPTGCMQNTLP